MHWAGSDTTADAGTDDASTTNLLLGRSCCRSPSQFLEWLYDVMSRLGSVLQILRLTAMQCELRVVPHQCSAVSPDLVNFFTFWCPPDNTATASGSLIASANSFRCHTCGDVIWNDTYTDQPHLKVVPVTEILSVSGNQGSCTNCLRGGAEKLDQL